MIENKKNDQLEHDEFEERDITPEEVQYTVGRIVDSALEAIREKSAGKESEYDEGRREAFYEVLLMLKNDFEVAGQDLSKYGLDFDLEREYLFKE